MANSYALFCAQEIAIQTKAQLRGGITADLAEGFSPYPVK